MRTSAETDRPKNVSSTQNAEAVLQAGARHELDDANVSLHVFYYR